MVSIRRSSPKFPAVRRCVRDDLTGKPDRGLLWLDGLVVVRAPAGIRLRPGCGVTASGLFCFLLIDHLFLVGSLFMLLDIGQDGGQME